MTGRERRRREAQATAAVAERFLGINELAARWLMTPGALYQLRHRGAAPPAHRIGKRLLFDVDDVLEFERARRDGPKVAS